MSEHASRWAAGSSITSTRLLHPPFWRGIASYYFCRFRLRQRCEEDTCLLRYARHLYAKRWHTKQKQQSCGRLLASRLTEKFIKLRIDLTASQRRQLRCLVTHQQSAGGLCHRHPPPSRLATTATTATHLLRLTSRCGGASRSLTHPHSARPASRVLQKCWPALRAPHRMQRHSRRAHCGGRVLALCCCEHAAQASMPLSSRTSP